MKAGVGGPDRAHIPERTFRTDRWWAYPLSTGAILVFFTGYALVRYFMNDYYWAPDENLLTPMYSPCISEVCPEGASHFGTFLPEMWPIIPIGFITFGVLLGFRATCYYYRKAAYRSLMFSPAACAVPEPAKKYSGERKFPFVLTNGHRYFFYAALLFAGINVYDAVLAFHGKDGGIGMGVGTVVILINVVMLSAYTLSCHACRHILGGKLKNFSKHPVRYRFWVLVSKLNPRHGQFAMISLFTVIFTDAYIMAVSAGWITDLRIFN
jgi:hypothetical protein